MRHKTTDILTAEEWRVAEAIASGRTIKEVSQHLCKSANTIVNQVQSVYEKACIPHNLNALAVWYVSKKNSIELPEFMRQCGALMVLMFFMATFNSQQEYRMVRRPKSRRNESEIMIYD